MIRLAIQQKNIIKFYQGKQATDFPTPLPLKSILWIDVINPTPEELSFIETYWKTSLTSFKFPFNQPLKAKLFEITLLTSPKDSFATSFNCTIFLLPHSILTLRSIEAFSVFDKMAHDQLEEYLALFKEEENTASSPHLFLLYFIHKTMEQFISSLNSLSENLENISYAIFNSSPKTRGKNYPGFLANGQPDLKYVIRQLGQYNNFLSKVEDCFTSLNLLLENLPLKTKLSPAHKEKVSLLKSELQTLLSYTSSLNDKISFLQSGATSLIGIQQSTFAQTLSILAAIFAPPALIAGCFGMNFDPSWKLEWQKGVLLSLSSMGLSALLPYLYFKYKKRL